MLLKTESEILLLLPILDKNKLYWEEVYLAYA